MRALKTRLSRYDPARYDDGVVAVRRRNPRARHWPAVVATAAVVGALGVSVWVARSGADGPTPADSAGGQGLTTVTQIDGVDVLTGTPIASSTRSFTATERAAFDRAVTAAEQDAGLGVPDYDRAGRVLTIRYVQGHEPAADTLAARLGDSTAGAIRIVVEPAEHSYQELEAIVHDMVGKTFGQLSITSTYVNTTSGRAVVVVDSMDEGSLRQLAGTIDPTATEIRYSDEHFTKAVGSPP